MWRNSYIFVPELNIKCTMKGLIFSIIFMLAPLSTLFAQDVVGKWKLSDGTAIVEVYKDK